MNLPNALISSLRRTAALTVVAAGTLFSASCALFPPPEPQPPGFAPAPPPNKYGFRGTDSPNYPTTDPRALPGNPSNPGTQPPKEIKRDPQDTHVNIEPPPKRTVNPPVEAPPSSGTGSATGSSGSTNPPPATKPAQREDLPYGIPAVGRSGFVYSPYAEDRGLVDVQGMKRGTRVECPYTKKHFRVP